MDALFGQFQFTTYSELIAELSPVRFPTSEYITGLQVIALKSAIRHNANVLLDHVHAALKFGILLSEEHLDLLNQLRLDCYEVRTQCGKVSVNFLRRRQRLVAPLRASYEDMKIGAILLCQQEEPTLIDSLADALG